jgi:trk system potassium uptake protein TrkH
MNKKLIARIVGTAWLAEAVLLLPSLGVALYKGDPFLPYLATLVIAIGAGIPLVILNKKATKETMFARDGLVAVAFTWIAISLVGALPFYISGEIGSFLNCLFESVSGFTTTGSTIMADVESLSKGLLLWRSATQWIGGMGVLLFMLALLPGIGSRSSYILRAESTGVSQGRIVPKLGASAKILYLIYIALTFMEVISLKIAGLSLFDAVIHSFSTAGTGGFSSMNASVGGFASLAVENIIFVFMLLFGINFSLYYFLLIKEVRKVTGNDELRVYLGIILVSIAFVTWDIYHVFGSISESLRHASFQVVSLFTTTGFSTMSYDVWPNFSKMIFLFLYFCGASAGSTAGGFKVVRLVVLFKTIRRELGKLLHPRQVNVVKLNGQTLEEQNVFNVLVFFAVYLGLAVLGALIISIDNFGFEVSFSSAISSLSSVGPMFGQLQATESYLGFSALSKITMLFLMLLGRLEIFPILILFAPSTWRNMSRRKAIKST